MALKYVVKKTTFGFDKEKAEKYVARPFNVVTVDFKMPVSYTHLSNLVIKIILFFF